MAVARDLAGGKEHVIAVAGDAAFTNGITFEALNNIAEQTKRLIVVLNDNEWSIDRNVGAIARYFHRIVTSEHYTSLHDRAKRLVEKIGGKTAVEVARRAEEAAKSMLWPSIMFEEFGLQYYGPIDGHNLPLLISSLEFAKTCNTPVVLHVLTKKGKGYDAALRQPEKFHGCGPYDVNTGETAPAAPGAPPQYQDVLGQTLVRLCQKDNSIVGITAAMPSGTGLKHLEKAFPKRYFDVGIAEEHAVLFAAGMATMGLRPVVAIYSSFMQRAFDCIVHDVALQNLPVILCMDRAGLSANDGPTHHGLFDIAYLRCVPNLVGMAPRNEDEFADMLFTATHQQAPVFIRYPRGAAEGVPIKDQPRLLEIGKAEITQAFVQNGRPKVALFGLGNLHSLAVKTAEKLMDEGCDCAVIDPRFTKPIDAGITEFFGRAAEVVITFEDHVLAGGYGSSVLELFSEKGISTPVVRIGWPDQFIEHASTVDYLRTKYGLTVENAVAQVQRLLPGLQTGAAASRPPLLPASAGRSAAG